MPRYHVHIYREMRLLFEGIEAASHEEAAKVAAGKPTSQSVLIDDCEGDNIGALVDVAGDKDFAHSRVIEFEPERLRQSAEFLAETLTSVAVTLTRCHRGAATAAEVEIALAAAIKVLNRALPEER